MQSSKQGHINAATWQQDRLCGSNTRLVRETSTSLKSSQWMQMTIAKMWKMKHRSATPKAQMAWSINPQSRQRLFTTWNPPHVEKTQSILQLHLEDDDRRRFEQCIRLEIRGSVKRLREQQAHEVMVNVRRERESNETILGSHEPWAANSGTTGTMNLCNITKDSERSHQNLGHPPVQQWENLLREARSEW